MVRWGRFKARLTGRALLTIGLALVGLGLAWIGAAAPAFNYIAMLGGMLVAGTGAGILNGETAKVSMTAIPPERAGMASGVAGTVRFSGIVLGFAALGAILSSRVASFVAASKSTIPVADRAALIQEAVAGNLPSVGGVLHEVAAGAFGRGYQAIFFSGAVLAVVAALLAWMLVRASETTPVPRRGGVDHLPVE